MIDETIFEVYRFMKEIASLHFEINKIPREFKFNNVNTELVDSCSTYLELAKEDLEKIIENIQQSGYKESK